MPERTSGDRNAPVSDGGAGAPGLAIARPASPGDVLTSLTRRLFAVAGLRAGMRVLDVGLGAGDTAFQAAEVVGAGGQVVALDRDAGVIELARRRARAAGLPNVAFHEGDIWALPIAEPFDAVVGRLILMHQPDPAGALRVLLPHLRPGGLVVCQEVDLHAPMVMPPLSLLTQILGWMTETATRAKTEARMGAKLYPLFLAAGLPAPTMQAESVVSGGVARSACTVWADLVRAMLPAMECHGAIAAAEVEIETLADRLCAEVVAGGGCLATPTFVGAWARRR